MNTSIPPEILQRCIGGIADVHYADTERVQGRILDATKSDEDASELCLMVAEQRDASRQWLESNVPTPLHLNVNSWLVDQDDNSVILLFEGGDSVARLIPAAQIKP